MIPLIQEESKIQVLPLEVEMSEPGEEEGRRMLGTRWLTPEKGMRVRLAENSLSAVKELLDQRGIPHQAAVGTVERVRCAPGRGSSPEDMKRYSSSGTPIFCDVLWECPKGSTAVPLLITMHHTGWMGNFHLELVGEGTVESKKGGAGRSSSFPAVLASEMPREAVTDSLRDPGASPTSKAFSRLSGMFSAFGKRESGATVLATGGFDDRWFSNPP